MPPSHFSLSPELTKNMKTLVAIVVSGMVVIATALGFMMMQQEMKWKDAEITKLKKNQAHPQNLWVDLGSGRSPS
jgi:hypothetical protein